MGVFCFFFLKICKTLISLSGCDTQIILILSLPSIRSSQREVFGIFLILGIAGLTQKKCFDVEMPEQLISDVLSGGGKQNDYFLESQLENSNTIEIDANSITAPKTIEELQTSYMIFDSKGLGVSLR